MPIREARARPADRQPAPSASTIERPAQDRRPVATRTRPRSSARLHPPCPGSRTRTRNRRDPRRGPGAGRPRSSRRHRRRARRPPTSCRCQLASEPEHQRVDARVGGQHVRAEPDDHHGEPLRLRPARAPRRARRRSRGRAKRGRGAAGADRGHPRERGVARDLERHVRCSNRSTIARASFHGSPTPNVITRSPARAHASGDRGRVVVRRRPPGAHGVRERADDETPGDAFARARRARRVISVTIAASASPSASPSSRWSCRVRSTTCGW